MADEDGPPPYAWVSAEPLPEGAGEPESAKYVKAPGKAKITYPNGDTFDGTFNADKAKHGRGKYVWTKELGEEGPKNAWVPLNEEGDAAALPEARVIAYDGEYKDGLRHGIGRMTFPNGDVYHGAWEAGTPNGQGTYYYASGDLYSGQWKAGKKEGRGAYVYKADDSQLVGIWESGTLTTGKWVWADGTSWHGSFRGNRPFGRGVFYFPSGNMQDGEYLEKKGEDEEDGDGDEEDAAPRPLVWRGGAVVPGTADSRDLLAPPPAADSGASAAAAASAESKTAE